MVDILKLGDLLTLLSNRKDVCTCKMISILTSFLSYHLGVKTRLMFHQERNVEQ